MVRWMNLMDVEVNSESWREPKKPKETFIPTFRQEREKGVLRIQCSCSRKGAS